ncbi:MAG: SDR family oxidoreductase [Deltaproteobacteria bacterium]|nr:SDR family oxidoreductase [Deltaproteobacteria bacterium]
MGKLEGKSAVITGGGSGIGRACALKLAEEGARVMVADIREDIARETADLVNTAGGSALFFRCDVSNEAEVEAMTAKTIEQFGGLHILVSNAGNLTRGGIHETSLADWERVIRVQLTGTFLCARAALRHMIQHGGGSIITMGSVSSVVIGAGGSAASYKAAKGGILQLTRAIATEYAHRGVRANCVCPGAVATDIGKHTREDSVHWTSEIKDEPRQYTPQAPMMRAADPMEIANVVAFLASDESSFMTGSAVMVDGGYTAI